jgi:hypothetical protein
MVETKDKVVTLESLAILHAYNKNAYMSKTDNVFALMDLDEAYLQYNPNDFVSFIMEIENADNETKQIMFPNKTSNSETLDVKAQTSSLDENGDILLYELCFYLENDEYIVNPTLTKIELLTGTKTSLHLSYAKLYGIKIV